MERTDWQSENTCKLSFHWPVKIEGDTSMCLWYKEREKGCRELKVQLSQTLGSFRLDYKYEIEYEYDFRISNQLRFQSPCSSCWF